MKLLIALILIFIGTNLNAQNFTDTKGKKQGVWSKTYPGSKVYQYKGQFKDDKPVGTFTYFYPTTKVKAIIKHDGGSNRSVAYFYHENTKLMSSGIYRDMKKDSIWLNFGPSGKLSSSETYKNDLLDGKKIVYYVPEQIEDNSRRISATSNYVSGKIDGEYLEFFENGTIKIKGSYALDKKIGIWYSYHPNGKKMMLERFKNGVRHGWAFGYDEKELEIGRFYYYYGSRLEGKELEHKLAQFKEKGINPNE